ncbi:MAG: hypothetical protein IPG69_14550 [Flavobacteriales bacterium]|nr:hypothetical protein [Flavobacteriales bacterium]
MPAYVDELSPCAAKIRATISDLHPARTRDSQFLFEDGTVVRMHADAERLADEFAERTTAGRASVLEFLRRSKVKRELTDEVFLQRSRTGSAIHLNGPTLRGVLQFHKVGGSTVR